jgi:hypothetical protein
MCVAGPQKHSVPFSAFMSNEPKQLFSYFPFRTLLFNTATTPTPARTLGRKLVFGGIRAIPTS